MANQKKKEFFLKRWFKRMFLGADREVKSILEEEQVQTPMRTVAMNFLHRKTAMVGVVIFLCIFLLVLIGPEGDFSPAEIDAALRAGFEEITLGTQRLRTETAAVVATVMASVANAGQ